MELERPFCAYRRVGRLLASSGAGIWEPFLVLGTGREVLKGSSGAPEAVVGAGPGPGRPQTMVHPVFAPVTRVSGDVSDSLPRPVASTRHRSLPCPDTVVAGSRESSRQWNARPSADDAGNRQRTRDPPLRPGGPASTRVRDADRSSVRFRRWCTGPAAGIPGIRHRRSSNPFAEIVRASPLGQVSVFAAGS